MGAAYEMNGVLKKESRTTRSGRALFVPFWVISRIVLAGGENPKPNQGNVVWTRP